MIRLDGICKSFGEQCVLQNACLTLSTGITGLSGASGSGKTTLMRILLGLLAPDAGTVSGVPAQKAAVFQEDRLVESLTVQSNLRLVLGKRFNAHTAQAHLEALGMPDALKLNAGALSGGMKRRVALCRAMLADAPLIALDEPFKGLDAEAKTRAMDYVQHFTAGKTVLLITHDASECAYLGARAVRLSDIQGG